ncbi:shikimate dehydrogenase [Flavobacteriaceae bacterium MAR_2010_72]|nr:shikimate dehydrogenase [Flavobacteriaceae bacterium MAR_2010_72]TVZ60259.1 shikimate dehydrogenase [Flavobacteriaceae bacterium MAR_2010_105]
MDKKLEKAMSKLGLLGKDISYSFSRTYFTSKFKNEHLPFNYENFDIEDISEFPSVLKSNPNLVGLNVTIPYKEAIIPYLDAISDQVREIGAVNTITFSKDGKLKGYNTDCYGFENSIKPYIKPHHKKALILGTGGASKAIAYTLKQLGIEFHHVSRAKNAKATFTYDDLTEAIIGTHTLIINCTPVGTHPKVNDCPDIPYDGITKAHLLYDLIYNPQQTKFLTCGEILGATTANGLEMLELQAEKAWQIWNLA